MQAQIRVDHTRAGGRIHAHATHMVKAVLAVCSEVCGFAKQVRVRLHFGDRGERLGCRLHKAADGFDLAIGDGPVHLCLLHAKLILLVREADAAAAAGLLFAVHAKRQRLACL
jgi:hypothetical protein